MGEFGCWVGVGTAATWRSFSCRRSRTFCHELTQRCELPAVAERAVEFQPSRGGQEARQGESSRTGREGKGKGNVSPLGPAGRVEERRGTSRTRSPPPVRRRTAGDFRLT